MDEDIFDIENDPEMQELAREAQGRTIPVSYITIAQPAPVQAPQAPIVNESKQKYEQAPWLLSTRRTLAKAGIKYYEGYDFSYDRDRGRYVKPENVGQAFTVLYHNTILPNSILAERAGYDVSFENDVCPAIKYAMRHRKSKVLSDAWTDVAKNHEWNEKNIYYPFFFYVKGILRKPEVETPIPVAERITLDKYLEGVSKYHPNFKFMKFGKSPKLNMLIEAFTHDREIADMSYQELIERFNVSRDTVSDFKKWVKGRRESGKEDGQSFVIPR